MKKTNPGEQNFNFSKNKLTLIMIHGAGDSSIFWRPLLDQFDKSLDSFNLLPLDLPGHGEDNSSPCSSIKEYAEFIDNLIISNNIPNPVPCGISMGGAIALQLLLDGRSDFKSGIIINSGAKLKVMPMIFDILENDYKTYIDSLPLFAISESTDKSKIDFLVKELSQTDPKLIYSDFKACNSFDITQRIGEIDQKVLILSAEHDKLTSPHQSKFLVEKIKNATHLEIKDSGHISPIETPEKVRDGITGFLKTIGQTN